MRKSPFVVGEYYHIYNRGVDKREVFANNNDYVRFLKNLREFNSKFIREERARLTEFDSDSDSESESNSGERLVDIIAYCLNPNHYHLILKQISEKGIEKFMQKVGTGYTNYFNIKNKRSGALFQGKFKSVHIDSDDYLLYLSAYINENNFIHGYGKRGNWKYASLWEYLGKTNQEICNKKIILDQFRNINDYKEFLDKNATYLKEKKELNRYLLE